MRWLQGIGLALVLPGCASFHISPRNIYLVQESCGDLPNCYSLIQDALNAAKRDNPADWVEIDVAAGDYYEKVTIDRPKTLLRGQGREETRLHFDAVAETAGKYHRANWGTPGSATLMINADQVTVEGITVENTFDYLANDALPADDERKISNSQGVALLLDIDSDRVFFNETSLIGYQDTVFANGKRAFVRNSFISGNVDFIFGNGQLLIEDSTIESRRRSDPSIAEDFQSFIAAPSTQLSDPVGIVFYRSRLTREEGVPDGSVALARPWHPTTRFPDGRYADPNAVGQASFIDCYMDAHIHREHWTSMNGTARDGSKTDVFQPQDSRFEESGSYGPGAEHVDIGLNWTNPLTIADIHRVVFEGWPASER
jgi:pectinesterase